MSFSWCNRGRTPEAPSSPRGLRDESACQRQIQSAKMVPGAGFGKLGNRLREWWTGVGRLAKEECRHAAVEEHRNARLLCLPERECVLSLTAMPGQGGFLVGPGRTPV